MSEGLSAERLAELERRWEADPTSRAFVQLAEEYRRTGDLARAAEVLQKGLESHPHYLSALVALGRCRFELGDADGAIEVLGRALAQDPTQLVANKLLVEAYLTHGQPESALERLDFYRLFNDRDEEIEGLQRRIDAALKPVPAGADGGAPRSELVFDLGLPSDLRPIELGAPSAGATLAADRVAEPFGSVHDTATADRRLAVALASGGVFAISAPMGPEPELRPAPLSPVARAAALAPGAAEPRQSEPPAKPPWGSATLAPELEHDAVEMVVAAPFRPQTIGEEVERETIEEPFDEVLQARSVGPRESRTVTMGGEAPAAEPAPELDSSVGEVEAEDAWDTLERDDEDDLPSEAGIEEEAPSSTLGELYLSQGHLDEAEAEFARVLATRAHDRVASAGIVEIERRRAGLEDTASGWAAEELPELEAAVTSPEVAPARKPTGGGLSRRKIATLRSYLQLIRRGRGEDARVS